MERPQVGLREKKFYAYHQPGKMLYTYISGASFKVIVCEIGRIKEETGDISIGDILDIMSAFFLLGADNYVLIQVMGKYHRRDIEWMKQELADIAEGLPRADMQFQGLGLIKIFVLFAKKWQEQQLKEMKNH